MGTFGFSTYDEDKKKKASQVAAKQEEVKQSSKYNFALYSDTEQGKKKAQAPAEIKPIEPPKKEVKQESPIVAKAKQVASKVVSGVKEFFGGKEQVQVTDENGVPKVKPAQVNMSDDDYVKTVGTVYKFKIEAEQALAQAKAEQANFYKEVPLTKRLSRLIPGDKKEQEFQLDLKVKALERAVKDYDHFLGNESTNRGFLSKAWSNIKDPINTFTPFLSDVATTYNSTKGLKVLGKYEKGEELDSTEKAYLSSLRASYYNQYVSAGLGDMAADVMTGVPKFGMEMLLTAGVVNPLTKGIGKKVLMEAVEKTTAKTISAKLISSSVKLAAQGSVAIPTISARTANYMLPTYDIEQKLGDGDILANLKPGDGPLKATTKAYLSTLVDYVTEGVGDWLDEAGGFVKKAFIGKWIKNKNLTDPSIVATALKNIHFNSLVGEVIEEEIGEPLNALIDQREYNDPFSTPEGRERLLVEVLGIGAFSGMASVSDKVAKQIRQNRIKNDPEPIDIPTKEDSPETIAAATPTLTPLPDVINQELAPKNEEGLATVGSAGVETTLKDTDELVAHLGTGGFRTDEQIAKLRSEIIAQGIRFPITIVQKEDGTYEINDGTHRIQIAKDLGIKQIPTKVLDEKGNNISKKVEEDKKKDKPEGPTGVGKEITLYHGSPKADEIAKTGIKTGWFTPDKKLANKYGKSVEIKVSEDKLLDMNKYPIDFKDPKAMAKLAKENPGMLGLIDRSPTGNQDEDLVMLFPGTKPTLSKPDEKKKILPSSKKKEVEIKATEEKKAEVKKGDLVSFTDNSGKKQVGEIIGEEKNGNIEVSVDKVVTDSGRVAVKEITTYPIKNLVKIDDSAKIEPNGETNRVTGGEDNRGGLPSPIQVGDGESTIAQRNIALDSEQVSPGLDKGGETSNGERLGSRITAKEQISINQQIEQLISEKGTTASNYTDEDKALLRMYTGSGGLGAAGADGRGLLDEYYTPKPIVDSMWKKLNGLFATTGVTAPAILEPSVGIGRFIESAPKQSRVAGYEINPTSATIAQILNPQSLIHTGPFESLFMDERGNKKTPKQKVDLVIGNPPYGEHRGKYLGLGEESKIKKFEEYFIKRGMDLLNDNGILAYVLPSSWLRSGESYAKTEIAKVGTLLKAYRLPNGVFGTTDIGTDIVFIQKIPSGSIGTDRLIFNHYFDLHPEDVLGKEVQVKGRYGMQAGVEGTLEDAIAQMSPGTSTVPEVAISPVESEIQEAQVVEDLKENLQAVEAEVKDSGDEKKVITPRVNRKPTAEEKAIAKANEKAIFEPKKKDKTISLSKEMTAEDQNMWDSVEATGELSESYSNSLPAARILDNTKIAVMTDNGRLKYYPNFIYYSGDIYVKLDQLERDRPNMSQEQYDRQKKGLTAILPEPKKLSQINLQPINDFVRDIVVNKESRYGKGTLREEFESWMSDLPYEAFGTSSRWEVQGYLQGSIVNAGDTLRNIDIRKRRRQVGNSLFKRFLQDQLTDDQKKVVEDAYNRTFNAYYRPDYRQVPLSAPVNSTFKKEKLDVKEIQKEGAAFLAMKGVGLLGYDVGVGKTMTSILAINEVLKKGWAKRPIVVVPNGTYLNWVKEIADIMPGVKINLLANLGGKFKGDLKTMQIEEGSLSIVTYDGLSKLGFKDETYTELTADLQDTMRTTGGSKRGRAKEEEKIAENIGRAMRGTTQERYFEDLGFDHVTIDEVHNFKNIFAGAKLAKGQGNEFRNIRGSSSARGIKAYLMSQYILKNNNDRNVFLLSATPFTNNPLEIYSILSLMGKKRLEGLGLKNVNDFMSLFMEMKPSFVVKADQTVKEEDVIEKFQNLTQMQQLVTEYIDFRTGEEAGVHRPNRVKRTIPIQSNALQQQYIAQAQELFTSKEAGPIVAITELQNITLSPYLSRYNTRQPNFKDFVENSPKIMYTMEAIKQVKKDKPEVGQVIYMPRGVSNFPLLEEYLVKVIGYKRSQIGIIQGSMTVDQKQNIQNDFNSGAVKILIGTEAIKEGINLQERSTEMYHLHLPWNPTDMLQVEGRIWRQGNQWQNVRIHYPLVENSVDSFIFQKLETKEKRIKNLWSYKGDAVSVGDLNFEEMKLDLITDPAVRVQAEYSFEKAKEDNALATLKVELSFAERKIDKLKKLEEGIQQYTEYMAGGTKENSENQLKYYEDKVNGFKKDLVQARKELTEQGIEVPVLEEKSKKLLEDIVSQEKKIEGLKDFYAEKAKQALNEKTLTPPTKTDYKSLVNVIADENKTFYVKAVKPTRTAPSGTADIGGYATLERAEETVQNIHTVEFPELLRIVQELTGTTPKLKIMKKALGRFYPVKKGMIKLSPEIFKNPVLAAKVFAHELGHLTDFLPSESMAHGNILGRLANLRKYMRGMYQDISNKEIRKELIDLSQAWKPYDPDENEGYRKYRESSKELYADAISVLFNDPAMLKEKAPKFWDAWFELIDAKPEVKEEFFRTWDLLNQSEEAVFNARQEAIYKGFDKGEDIWAAKTIDKQKEKGNLLHIIQTLFDDKNTPLNLKVKAAIKAGTKFEDRPNPMYEYEGLNYLDGKLKNFVIDNFQPSYELAQQVSDGHKILGQILILERTINERGELANPGGFDPRTATKQIELLQKSMSESDWSKLQQAKDSLRAGVQAVVELAEKNGYYTPDMIAQMKANPAYATYQVLDYLDTYISAAVHKQVGTLKDVANPATSTVMKAIATMKAIEYNNAKKSAVEFITESFKADITEAKSTFAGKGRRKILDSTDPDMGTVKIIKDGKIFGYYMEKGLANSINGKSSEVVKMIASVARKILRTDLYRALFTGFNLGFQTFNAVRDFKRAWKNLPNTSLPKMFALYVKASPAAWARAKHQLNPIIREMENNKALGFTYNDLIYTEDSEEKQIERVLQQSGVLPKTHKRGLLTPFYAVLEGIELTGNYIESLPKVAGYVQLQGKMSVDELAHVTRTKLGSPDFRKGGLATPISNTIAMFSNAIKEGIKEDFDSATNPKTRAGFWWKTIAVDLLPKALMMALIAGLGGEWWKKRFEDVSEYDKTNYTIIPLGVDENGKTTYLRIPSDETGRLIGGIFYKVGSMAGRGKADWKDFTDLFSFGAGQLPNVAPSITGLGAVITYLSGENPYDSFRGRNVIPDTEFKAGFSESFPIFIQWLITQQGLGIVMPNLYTAGDKSLLEKITGLPVLNNILGRWIKSSNYGQTEQLKNISGKMDEAQAKDVLKRREAVENAIKLYKDTSKTRFDEISAHKALVESVYGPGPYDSDTVEKANRLIKQFDIAVVKGKDDPNSNALIYAQTNAEKIEILRAIKAKMPTDEWKAFVNEMKGEKIIGPDVVEEARKMLKETSQAPVKTPIVLSMDTFRKMNIFNPPKASAKESMIDKDGFYTGEPWRIEASEKPGYVNFYYPSGSHSEIKEDKVEKYKRLVQDQFEWFGVGKFPKDAEDVTRFTKDQVTKLAIASTDEGASNALKSIPLIQDALKEQHIYSKKVMAYALATTQHETGGEMKPVKEGAFNDKKFGYKEGFTGRKQAQKRGYGGGDDFFGRGFIQLTHKENYERYGKKIGVDLVNNPELANEPKIAAQIMAVYFKETGIDKLVEEGKIEEARRKVNPDNKGKMIKKTFEKYLKFMPNYYK